MEFSYRLIKDQQPFDDVLVKLANEKTIGVDTEGDLDIWEGPTVLVQVAIPDMVYLFDVRHIQDLSALWDLLESKEVLKILQNAKYDYRALKHRFGVTINNIYDTMLAEQLLRAGIAKRGDFSLVALQRRYLDMSTPQEGWRFVGNPSVFTQEMLQYAATDAGVLLPIFREQVRLLREKGLIEVSRLEQKLVPVVAEMELAGILIDVERWQKFTEWLVEERAAYAREIYKLASEKIPQASMFEDTPLINLNSHVQIKNLFKLFDIELPNTQAATLVKYDHPLAANLVKYKTYQKLVSSFGDPIPNFVNVHTGRIHASFQQIGAASGRFSCRKPNLQQIPIKETKGFRECFIAPKGYKLITADYSMIELKIIAEYSQDENLLRAFNEGEDIHRLVASYLFNCDIADVTPDQRTLAKNMVYGMSYGISAKGFARRANISVSFARQLINIFKKLFPKAVSWLDLAGRTTVQKGYAQTMLGRKRWFEVPRMSYSDNRRWAIEREGRNHAIQGSSGDMLKFAMVDLFSKLPKEARIVNCIHDELIVEVPESIALETSNLVVDIMVVAGERFLPNLPVKVDVTIGDTWSK